MGEANKEAPAKRRPKHNFKWGSIFHTALNFVLPIVLLLLIRSNLEGVAVALVILSKWRIFFVQPRHWTTNLKYNSTDLIVKLSTLGFIIQSDTLNVQLIWTAWYIFWLIVVKPRSDIVSMGMQAIIGNFLGFSALFQWVDTLNPVIFIVGAWLIGFSTAGHFLSSYDEPLSRVFAHLWALFVAQLAWVLSHWVLAYLFIPQFAIITTLLAYTVASLYHHNYEEKLKPRQLRDQILLTLLILIVIIAVGDWTGEV